MRVARAGVENDVAFAYAERREGVEQAVGSARLEAALQCLPQFGVNGLNKTSRRMQSQFGVTGPELVELLDRGHYPAPPAIAGRRMTVAPWRTGVSAPSSVRTSSPST